MATTEQQREWSNSFKVYTPSYLPLPDNQHVIDCYGDDFGLAFVFSDGGFITFRDDEFRVLVGIDEFFTKNFDEAKAFLWEMHSQYSAHGVPMQALTY